MDLQSVVCRGRPLAPGKSLSDAATSIQQAVQQIPWTIAAGSYWAALRQLEPRANADDPLQRHFRDMLAMRIPLLLTSR
jgi:hypothetical protein